MADCNVTLEVNRSDLATTRLLETDDGTLERGQVRLRIERFALTSNNITYAVVGDLLGYWTFFPATEDWGRIPAMGWADVVESANPDIAAGGRYFGWFPMARSIVMTVGATDDGMRDDGVHRLSQAAIYRSYTRTDRDPWYQPGDDREDRHALLRGLFVTGLLIDEFFADHDYFGARAAVVLSASSKTAVAFAKRAALRDEIQIIGVTSPHNVEFVTALGCYDTVIAYDAVASIRADTDAVSVDMAGDSRTLAALHAHLGGYLRYSMIVGNTHHGSPAVQVSGGPTSQFFFAATELSRRQSEWGTDVCNRRIAEALFGFVEGSQSWLDVERRSGTVAAAAAYGDVYAGAVAPSTGLSVSLHER